jgi:hypothetical protein
MATVFCSIREPLPGGARGSAKTMRRPICRMIGSTICGRRGKLRLAMSEDRLQMARRHVVEGRKIIDAQQAVIARLRAMGEDTSTDERILRRFEQNQAMFEEDLKTLEAKYLTPRA